MAEEIGLKLGTDAYHTLGLSWSTRIYYSGVKKKKQKKMNYVMSYLLKDILVLHTLHA